MKWKRLWNEVDHTHDFTFHSTSPLISDMWRRCNIMNNSQSTTTATQLQCSNNFRWWYDGIPCVRKDASFKVRYNELTCKNITRSDAILEYYMYTLWKYTFHYMFIMCSLTVVTLIFFHRNPILIQLELTCKYVITSLHNM